MRRLPSYCLLLTIVVLAAALRLWNLDDVGFGRHYYAAAVFSQLQDARAFLYNAFDAGGFVSVDKPPVGLWMQVLGARLLGFGPTGVILPQVVQGLLSVVVLYALVRRQAGEAGALAAALLFAVTPVCVAVDRSNNLESCLTLVLLLATWVGQRAAETGSPVRLGAAMALVGIGFNVKMGAALAVVPGLLAAYLAFNPAIALRRRLLQAAVGGLLLAAVSLAWIAAFDLTPPDRRPYAGSTAGNTMHELALVHNGIGRFLRPVRAPDAGARPQGVGARRLYDDSPVGPLRLLRPQAAGQVAWWLPVALAGIGLGWRRRADDRDAARPADDAVGRPADDPLRRRRIGIVLWVGWLVVFGVLFSMAGGVFHTYYVAVLAPPLAALGGQGAVALWRRRTAARGAAAIAVALLATGAWQAYLGWGQTGVDAIARLPATLQASAVLPRWLVAVAAVAGIVLLGAALACRIPAPRSGPASTVRLPRPSRTAAAAAAGALALLALPLLAAVGVSVNGTNPVTPAANLAAYGLPARIRAADPGADGRRRLLQFLGAQRRDETFLVAVPNAVVAAPLITASGLPVMALGGYLGNDPILTPEGLAARVARGDLRFAMTGGFALPHRVTPAEQALLDWIAANGRPVDPSSWLGGRLRPGQRIDTVVNGEPLSLRVGQLYDLRR